MGLFEELKELGVDVEEGCARVMDDQPLYETMLGMFVDRVDANPIQTADFAGDCPDSLIGRVHMLKGLTGNLAMTPLFAGYVRMLELLRGGRAEEAGEIYEELRPVQTAIAACIRRHRQEQQPAAPQTDL